MSQHINICNSVRFTNIELKFNVIVAESLVKTAETTRSSQFKTGMKGGGFMLEGLLDL